MFDRYVRVVGLALFLTGACGGEQESLEVHMTRGAALSIALDTARVDLHTNDRECTKIRSSGPTARASYSKGVDLTGAEREEGGIFGIRPNTYTLIVWGFNAGAQAIAAACAQNVVIEDGKRTKVELVLEPYSKP